MGLVEKSLSIALEAHAGQVDKAGRAYILHAIRVMSGMSTDDERAVALLHDVLEDSNFVSSDLLERGIPVHVVAAVEALTKREGEDYQAFIEKVMRNSLAVKIKIADIEDNLNVLRLDSISDKDLIRVGKYHSAWKILQGE